MFSKIYSVSFLFIVMLSSLASSFAWEVEDLEKLVKQYERKHSFHGNVLIKKDGEVIYTKSVGLSHVESNTPQTINSKFMVASLSKSFTAAAILLLEERGELSVEDSVSKYVKLPKNTEINKEKWEAVKIKHLLNHTSGLIRDFGKNEYLDRAAYNTLQYILPLALKKERTLFFDAGEKFYYSNFGYVVLAAVIENVSFNFYADFIRTNFLLPNKILDTGEYHRFKVLENMADGYYYNEDNRLRKRCCDDATSLRGAASIYSTVDNLSKWMGLIINSEEKLGLNLLDKMTEQTVEMDEMGNYGYGLMIEKLEGLTRIHHNGHEWGYVSSMNYFPEENLEIIVLANRHEFIGWSGFNAAHSLSGELAATLIK